MTLMAVTDNIIAVSKGSNVDYYDYSTHTVLDLKLNSVTEDDNVKDLVISRDKKLLAILLSSSKRVIVYEIPELKVLQSIILPRSASKVRFGVNSDQILVADKTGDVLIYKMIKDDKGIKILGHLSLLLNVLQTDDGKYIITSDRDEKIKVSCYPNTYNIQTYCLGHKEFVNHIELLHTPGYLMSASGDGTVKIWNYTNGKLIHTIDIYDDVKNYEELKQEFSKCMDEEGIEIDSLPIVDCTITKLNQFTSLIGLTIHSYLKVLIYQLRHTNEAFHHNFVTELACDVFPTAIQFHNLSLFIYDKVNCKVLEYNIKNNNNSVLLDLAKEIQVFTNKTAHISGSVDLESIKVLYKRKFDNVKEYKERKKLRLEKK